MVGQLLCQEDNGEHYLAVTEDECSRQSSYLNAIMLNCFNVTSNYVCVDEVGESLILRDGVDCDGSIEHIEAIITEYSRETVDPQFECVIGGYLAAGSEDACNGDVGILNQVIGSFLDGSFDTCVQTTPTTSVTTTATSTATESSTTTQTSSATTSASTTASTTPTTYGITEVCYIV